MNKKLILVIALIGIGLYALPATMSLFAGQHSFVNIDAVGNQIDCIKCHGDVQAELSAGATGTNAPHAGFSCELCHRVRAGEASGDNAYSAITYTASVVNLTGSTNIVRRTLIVTERDMEARNVPVNMLANAPESTVFAKLAILMSGKQVQEVLGFKEKLSACYKTASAVASASAPAEVPCDSLELAATLSPSDPREFQATSLYGSDGLPLDQTSTTRNGAFDASKIIFVYGGTQSTRAPYGWTWGLVTGGFLPDKTTPVYGFNGAGSEVSNAGTKYHAASLVSCLECHGGEAPTGHHDAEYGATTSNPIGCEACHYQGGANKGGLAGIMAGGFGLGVTAQDEGSLEVHKNFVKNPDGVLVYEASPLSGNEASNTACVACHTHVDVDISYTKPTAVKIEAAMGSTSGNAGMTTVVSGGSTITHSGVTVDPYP